MPVRILAEKTGNYTPPKPIPNSPSHTDPATLALMLSLTDDIDAYRAGNPTHQPTEPDTYTHDPETPGLKPRCRRCETRHKLDAHGLCWRCRNTLNTTQRRHQRKEHQ
ncbi:hypothetical protein [Bifidobacterium platyrrhinorum]|uniref:Uncharacterized protein n=1 Tax=Bifidobacterium platyrrhinorum TaxID=2661628 RepID=A0A6L9SWG6_9BIFI|nr:hypothetical protein [Bifidobacterium platyrrhinorum]NEG56153.1 hypothetical protein [Bifidobacterium platyrrhinorum]